MIIICYQNYYVIYSTVKGCKSELNILTPQKICLVTKKLIYKPSYLLKTDVYTHNLNTEPFLCNIRVLRYLKNKSGSGIDTSLAAKGALANRLQRRTAYKIQNGCQGAPKFQRGSGKVSTPRFLGILSNFR